MALKVGDEAPDFTLPDQEGKMVNLKSLRGSPVVLYFYPKDDTPWLHQGSLWLQRRFLRNQSERWGCAWGKSG